MSKPRRVRTAPVRAVQYTVRRTYAGQLRAVRRAGLASTVGGRLQRRPVAVGDVVRSNQVLAHLDSRQFRHGRTSSTARLAEIRANLSLARLDLGRAQRLHTQRELPTADRDAEATTVEALTAREKAARTAVSEQRRLVRESSIRAPFDGIVSAVHFEPGEIVPPGSPVVTLVGNNDLEIEIELAEATRAALHVGDRVGVSLPLIERDVQGSIVSLGHAANGVGHLFPVLVALDRDASLAPGMTAEVHFAKQATALLSVPVSAVVSPGAANPSVFVVREGRLERVAVEVIELTHASALVRGPLVAGELAVTGGHSALAPHDAVEVAS
ncbi:MAG: efflux RND transporter periplasmic adaptor subunit [Nannocystaceae bacterium]|nr:efflux RND transporter periplasmic adaptor subunit [Nannocystaceae bacterium]